MPPDLKGVGGSVSLIRVPADGGIVEAYDPDSLREPIWTSRGNFPAVREVLGVNLESRLLVAVDTLKNLVAIDLESRGTRAQTTAVESAVMAPDGSVYTINAARRVTRVGGGLPVIYRTALSVAPAYHFGTLGERYVAILGTKPATMVVMTPERVLGEIEVSPGEAAATQWGDLLTIAADDRVQIYRTEEPFQAKSLRIAGHARHVLFSPSGHRIFVATDDPAILAFDRYTLAQLAEIDLPGVPARLRTDGTGRWLLARPTEGDSTWVVDLATSAFVGTVPSEWDSDLPTVAGAATVLTRQHGDLIALSIGPKAVEVGRIEGGGLDHWVVTRWLPRDRLGRAAARAESLLVAQDSLLGIEAGATAVDRLYLQVSSSQNAEWSKELAKQLTQGGYPARVLDPTTADDGFRVVIGPYESREAAEETGRRLGRPYFVLTNPAIGN